MSSTVRRVLVACATVVGVLVGGGAGSALLTAGTIAPASAMPVRLDPEREDAAAWAARGLLLLALLWVVIGMLSARTRLVRRPGAAAARATWIGSTRPWRARESTLGLLMLDRWLLIVIPAALLLGTRATQVALPFGDPSPIWGALGVVFVTWVILVGVVRLLVGDRSPWPVIATVAGVVILRCIVTLVPIAFSGEPGYWDQFWADPVRRTLYLVISLALFLWLFAAAGWALTAQFGTRRSVGMIAAAAGAAIVVPAVVVGVVGMDAALSPVSDGMGLLPWAYTRVPGMAMGAVDPVLPWVVAAAGAVVAGVGIVVARAPRRV